LIYIIIYLHVYTIANLASENRYKAGDELDVEYHELVKLRILGPKLGSITTSSVRALKLLGDVVQFDMKLPRCTNLHAVH